MFLRYFVYDDQFLLACYYNYPINISLKNIVSNCIISFDYDYFFILSFFI